MKSFASTALATFASLLCAAGVLAAETKADTSWVGYGGPGGTRVYADAAPPTTFTEKDIAWTTKLPDWGHGSPIVVGDRVFLQCEYTEGMEHYPSLVCVNAKDGRIAWKRLLDHTPALPNGEAVKDAWEKVMTDMGRRRELIAGYQEARRSGDDGSKQAALKAIDEAGYEYNARWNRLLPKQKGFLGDELRTMKQGGFTLETWRQNLGSGNTVHCIGQAHATPVSDGHRVYAQTAFGGFFCFDLDGRLIWVACVPGQAGEYCRNGRSPLLYKNLFISDITNKVRAFDKRTGELRWSDDGPAQLGREGAHTIVSPAVMSVAGNDILYAAGNCAYLLPDGKRLKVDGWKDYGMQTLVKYDERDVVFFCGEGEHCGWTEKGKVKNGPNPPAAVRFTLDGDTLRARVLWHGGAIGSGNGKQSYGGTAPWMLYHDGRFFHRNGVIMDALTGKHLAGKFDRRGEGVAVPPTAHLLAVAGDHVYGLKSHRPRTRGDDRPAQGAMVSVFTLDGKKVAENFIPGPQDADMFSYSHTFTFGGNALYIRGLNHLIKIGR